MASPGQLFGNMLGRLGNASAHTAMHGAETSARIATGASRFSLGALLGGAKFGGKVASTATREGIGMAQAAGSQLDRSSKIFYAGAAGLTAVGIGGGLAISAAKKNSAKTLAAEAELANTTALASPDMGINAAYGSQITAAPTLDGLPLVTDGPMVSKYRPNRVPGLEQSAAAAFAQPTPSVAAHATELAAAAQPLQAR